MSALGFCQQITPLAAGNRKREDARSADSTSGGKGGDGTLSCSTEGRNGVCAVSAASLNAIISIEYRQQSLRGNVSHPSCRRRRTTCKSCTHGIHAGRALLSDIRDQAAPDRPPSTGIVCPVINDDSSERQNRTAAAISSAWVQRCDHCRSQHRLDRGVVLQCAAVQLYN